MPPGRYMGTTDINLWTLGWGFTAMCDLSCPFCYSAKCRESIVEPEPPLVVAETFLHNNKNRIASVNFGTGECFLSPRFPRLLAICHDMLPQAQIAVTTNGAFVDAIEDSETLSIVSSSLTELDVSIDFADPTQHDAWRGKKGTWERAFRATRIGRQMGLKTSIVTLGTHATLARENICRMFDLASELDVALRVNLYMPTAGDFSFVPLLDSVEEMLEIATQRGAFMRISDRLLGTLYGCFCPGPRLANARSCRILPDGSVSPSTYLVDAPWVVSSRLDTIILADLPNLPQFEQYRSDHVPATCVDCDVARECRGGSVERRWLWWGTLDRADPLCPGSTIVRAQYPRVGSPSHTKLTLDDPQVHLDYLPTIIFRPLS